MKTVKLITCDDAFQAHVIQGALKNEGIASVLHNENMSSVMRGYVRDVTGVDIFVYEDEYDNALRLLERNQMIPEQLRYCPHCGSDEIKFVLKKSHRVRAVVAAVIAALSAAPPGTEHWEYVCRKCGTHFEKPEQDLIRVPIKMKIWETQPTSMTTIHSSINGQNTHSYPMGTLMKPSKA
jgi:DNA-directed RNA polymerase subunit M/transcription elongation factor TFIIS